jgi:hypothetical protein
MTNYRAVIFLLLAFSGHRCVGQSIPKGLEPVFKNVEPGKRFHPFWPPVSGQGILGTIVVADKPGKPKAFFRTIDSPTYRNPGYQKEFQTGEIDYAVPDLSQQKTIGADVAFAQLDAIASALKSGPNGQNLTGTGQSSTGCSSSSGSTSGQGSQSTSSNNPSGGTGNQDQQPNTNSNSCNVTGVDFNRFTNATVKVSGVKVIYYDLPTMSDIASNHALTDAAERILSKSQHGWFIHRVLVASSIEYTLVSNTKLDAGFFDKLISWIPTVSVSYNNDKTITLKTTSPLTLGYKLYQMGMGDDFSGQAVEVVDLSAAGIDASKIDSEVLSGTQ